MISIFTFPILKLKTADDCPRWKCVFFFSSRRRHTRFKCDWSSDVCSSDLPYCKQVEPALEALVKEDPKIRVVYRELLVDDPDLRILLHECLERRLDLLAIGAAVVEELDDGHVALGVAADRRGRVREQLLAIGRDHLARIRRLVLLDLRLGGPQHLDHELRVLEEVVVDDRLHRLLLLGCERVGSPGRGSDRACEQHGEGEAAKKCRHGKKTLGAEESGGGHAPARRQAQSRRAPAQGLPSRLASSWMFWARCLAGPAGGCLMARGACLR